MSGARIGIRELREDLSRAIRRVRSGQTLEVTDHGHPVARLVPIVPVAGALADLVARGALRPPRQASPLPKPLSLRSRMSSEEAIDLLRGG
jgi:prevent-host-death family protein